MITSMTSLNARRLSFCENNGYLMIERFPCKPAKNFGVDRDGNILKAYSIDCPRVENY